MKFMKFSRKARSLFLAYVLSVLILNFGATPVLQMEIH